MPAVVESLIEADSRDSLALSYGVGFTLVTRILTLLLDSPEDRDFRYLGDMGAM